MFNLGCAQAKLLWLSLSRAAGRRQCQRPPTRRPRWRIGPDAPRERGYSFPPSEKPITMPSSRHCGRLPPPLLLPLLCPRRLLAHDSSHTGLPIDQRLAAGTGDARAVVAAGTERENEGQDSSESGER